MFTLYLEILIFHTHIWWIHNIWRPAHTRCVSSVHQPNEYAQKRERNSKSIHYFHVVQEKYELSSL